MEAIFTPVIRSIGVELEGGWETSRSTRVLDRIKHDGSVRVATDTIRCREGEIASVPMSTKAGLTRFMRACYPDFVNASCGLHVHVTPTTTALWPVLLSETTATKLLNKTRAWGKGKRTWTDIDTERIRYRLRGESDYCRPHYNADAQIEGTGNRYTFFNAASIRRHKTLEIRGWPMFQSVVHAQEAVLFTVNTLTELVQKQGPEWKTQVKLRLRDVEKWKATGVGGISGLEPYAARCPECGLPCVGCENDEPHRPHFHGDTVWD